jgi:hypothetical protein
MASCGKTLDPADLIRSIRDLYAFCHCQAPERLMGCESVGDQQCGQEQWEGSTHYGYKA